MEPLGRGYKPQQLAACCRRHVDPTLSSIFSVSETEAAAIRDAYQRGGELASARTRGVEPTMSVFMITAMHKPLA